MKKCIKLASVLILSLSMCIPTSAFAQSSDMQSIKTFNDIKMDYTTMLGHEGRSYEMLVKGMLNDGLTMEEADYYAKMDIIVNQIEIANINGDDILENVQAYTGDYARINPDVVKNNALNLDPRALKTVLSQNDAVLLGNNDAQASIKTLGNKGYNITVRYPDGSKAMYKSSTVIDETESSDIKTNTNVVGPWSKSYMFDYDLTDKTYNTNYVSTSTWSFTSGGSYTKVSDVFRWTLGPDSHMGTSYSTVYYRDDTGSTSYAGVCSIDLEYLSNHINESASSTGNYIVGYTDARFTVSGSFTSTFGTLGISGNVGMGWHQYCITEVSNKGSVRYWAGQFN